LTLVFGFITAAGSNAPKNLDTGFIADAQDFSKELSAFNTRNALYLEGAGNAITDTVGNERVLNASGALAVVTDALLADGHIAYAEHYIDDLDVERADIRTNADSAPMPTLTVQSTQADSETMNRISPRSEKAAYVAKTVRNVAVYIPGTDTLGGKADADVLMLTVRYDAIGPEATAAAVAGAAVGHARALAQGKPAVKNDVLIVFCDAGLEHALGLYTFLHQFEGFNEVTSRIKLAADFDARGNRGPLVLYDASQNASKALSEFARGNSFVRLNSFTDSLTAQDSTGSAAAQSVNIPALSFANIGALRVERTPLDTADNLSQNVVRAHAEAMSTVISCFGNANLAALSDESAGETGVYFNYYGFFTASFPTLLAMLLSGLVIGLLIAVLAVNAKKKAFSPVKALLGALLQLLAIVGALAALYLVYLVASLFMAGFGVFTMGAFGAFNFMSVGVVISAMVVFGAIMVLIYVLLKKSFMVKANDVVRGNVLLVALAAIITAFAAPAISYLFTFLAALQLTVLLISTLIKAKFKSKFNFGVERMLLYVWPTVIVMPLFIAAIYMTAVVTSFVMLPVLLILFAMLAGAALPYADFLKRKLDAAFKKLPARSIRYEKEVTEMVEDRAKKGKFTSVTSKKIFKEKVKWNYKNRLGITVVTFIASLCLLLFASINTGGFHAKIVSNPATMQGYFYNGALNLVYADDAQTAARTTLEVRDRQAYRYISEHIQGMSWNAETRVHEKTISNRLGNLTPSVTPDRENNRVIYHTEHRESRIVLTVNNTQNMRNFTFSFANNKEIFDVEDNDLEKYEFVNLQNAPSLTFYLPFNSGPFICIEFDQTLGMEFQFEEQFEAKNIMLQDVTEIRSILDANFYPALDGLKINIIYRLRTVV